MKKIGLVFDGVYFGEDFVVLVFRSLGTNLHWLFRESEKIAYYEEALNELSRKYKFLSFTIDGRQGIVQLLEKLFPETPIQLCQFHQVKTVLKYTTRKPKTECGKELKELILELKSSSKAEFMSKYSQLRTKYAEFLKERNETGEFKHKRLRSAFQSIKRNLPYLFTFEDFPNLKIEKTTNSCDGYFSQLKSKVRLHSGINTRRKIQMINKLLSS